MVETVELSRAEWLLVNSIVSDKDVTPIVYDYNEVTGEVVELCFESMVTEHHYSVTKHMIPSFSRVKSIEKIWMMISNLTKQSTYWKES